VAITRITTDCACPTAKAQLSWIGEFEDVRCSNATGETHCYGHAVELWRSGACAVGVLTLEEGLSGNPRRALLDSVRYDRASGALAFVAKFPERKVQYRVEGTEYSSPSEYVFNGRLTTKRLVGSLLLRLAPQPAHPDTAEHVNLPRQAPENFPHESLQSCAEWKEWIAHVYRLDAP
jgi:hypothetical protein